MSDEQLVGGLLTRAARQLPPPASPDVSALVARARRRLRFRRGLATIVVVVVVASGIAAAAVSRGGRSQAVHVPAPAPTSPHTVFGVATGDVLVFDDGYDGVDTVDLDNRTVSRRVVDGQRAGDQPWRLTRSDDSLIVGWDGVSAWPLTGGASRLLSPDATFSVPAAEPGDVWLATYAGGHTGQGPLSVEEVTVTGTVVVPATTISDPPGIPAVGTPGGLAFADGDGLHLWDPRSGLVVRTLGSGTPEVGLPSPHRLAWCDGRCETLHITTFGGADLTVAPPPGALAFQAGSAQFSPDERSLAVVSSGPGPTDNSGGGRVVVIDTTTGTAHVVMSGVYTYSHLAWTPDGFRLYIASVPDASTQATLGEYDTRRGSTLAAALPRSIGGVFIVLPAAQARSLLATRTGPSDACPAPHVYPSNRSGTCGYQF